MIIKMQTKSYVFLIYIILAVAALVAYEPVRKNGFVNYDDTGYVTKNQNVQSGINVKSVIWAFTSFHMGIWHPLTWLSHMLDCQLFGLNPLGHHLVSLLLHILNALLLFWVLKRMTGAVWQSAFVAALFVLHPLRVESVAWASERKDVLSVLFWMLTMAAYLRYVEKPGFGRYSAVLLFLLLGLMAKPMLVTLPFVLLLLDYWPLERFGYQQQKKVGLRALIVEKIPMFVIVLASSIITFIAQRASGSVTSIEYLPVARRIGNASVYYLRYLGKMICPCRLAVFYPYQKLAQLQMIICFIAIVVISVVVLYAARRRRYLTVGWLWFLGTFVPMIGLVQIGKQSIADRYTYLPSIGISIMVVWAAAELVRRYKFTKFALAITGSLILLLLITSTRIQTAHWLSSLTLFEHTVKVTENNYQMHNNYAGALKRSDRFDEAVEQFKEAIRIKPDYVDAHYNLGNTYFAMNKVELAVSCWRKTLALAPEHAGALNGIAWVLAIKKDERVFNPDKAIEFAQKACKLTEYKKASYLDTLAVAYAAVGKFNEAISITEKALQIAQEEADELREEISNRLQLYKEGKPYRE